jgi:hypothetical protein
MHIPLDFYDSGNTTSIWIRDPTLHNDPFSSYYSDNVAGATITSISILVDGTQAHETLMHGIPCGISVCGEHIGEGGEVPHAHGDPYGPYCLYNNNITWYPTTASHPPLIGFTKDGGFIYGRYL